MKILKSVTREKITAKATSFAPGVIDVHKEMKRGNIDTVKKDIVVKANYDENTKLVQKLDITTWLPFAAKTYNISPDIRDYIFVPVFTIPSDLPNRNGVGFPLKSLIEFSPEIHMQAYKGFKGCPTFYEHDNEDPLKAHGVIADAYLKNLKGFSQNKVWKLLELLTFDRSKYVDTVKRIIDNDLNTYSMGALVTEYSCSYCGATLGKCDHIKKNRIDFYEKQGQVVFKNLHGILPIETSAVEVPAYSPAISDKVMT